ncbi:MAG: hypothetical protein KDG89_12275 [Geminicoccaceae bacterium]|nr:hypothetical protein [Geminicoccaceae bacterium]
MSRGRQLSLIEAGPRGAPAYELRARLHGGDDLELQVWQVPSPASPHLKAPLRVAGLRGRNLALVEPRVARLLKGTGVRLGGLPLGDERRSPLDEGTALNLGLLFRTLAPMRSRDKMRACAEGVVAMAPEEAAYWLGMAMHRKNPRRVLAALRLLVVEA